MSLNTFNCTVEKCISLWKLQLIVPRLYLNAFRTTQNCHFKTYFLKIAYNGTWISCIGSFTDSDQGHKTVKRSNTWTLFMRGKCKQEQISVQIIIELNAMILHKKAFLNNLHNSSAHFMNDAWCFSDFDRQNRIVRAQKQRLKSIWKDQFAYNWLKNTRTNGIQLNYFFFKLLINLLIIMFKI